MVSAEQARDIALFFLLSLLDRKHALEAAHRSIAHLKGLKPAHEALTPVEVASVLHTAFKSQRKALPRNRPTEMPEGTIRFPDGTDFTTWQKFHRSASDAEITAVILMKILGFGEDVAATAFNVSNGTMKYRVAKGMRQLGAVLAKTETRSAT